MTFDDILAQVLAQLQCQGRMSYRALKRRFGLDDEYIEDLKAEIIHAQHLAVDEDGAVLVWTGEAPETPTPASQPDPTPRPDPQLAEPTQGDSSSAEPRTPDAERRQLTVMFCDLVGSTELSGQLDPEDYREVVREYQKACTQVIERFDGYVAQYLGDGLLVYFGYPHSHEDEAQRAVYTGLGILNAMKQLNTLLQPKKGVSLKIRVGIHTGVVVVGDIGAGSRQEQLAMGETPNISARIQGLADADSVVISSSTHRLIQGYFDCQELGEQKLRGVVEPVGAYRVLKESDIQSRFEAVSTRGLTPLVGREQEIGLLLERWAQSLEGHGQLVLLSGDAGMGKSRLVHAWSEQVTSVVHTRIECHCSSYTQHSMLYPLLDQLQRVLQFERDDPPADKGSKLEAWLDRLDLSRAEFMPLLTRWLLLPLMEGYAPSVLSPQQQKQKIFEALLVWLLREAEAQPVCFVMEDLHWADPLTLDWLDFLLGHIPTSHMLVLLTFRPDFHPLWPPRDYIARLALNRLSPSQVDAMINEVTDGKALPAEIRQQLTAKTDGVPLFVEEMTRMVLDSGLVKERDGRYELADTPQRLAIPSTLHDALVARLDQLETGKHTVQLAATIGREFSYDLIRAVTGLDDTTLQQDLAQLIDATLLYQRGLLPRAQYHFKHALIQEAAYQSLLRATRRQYHQDIAQVLEAQFPETCEAQPELLAYHYTEAGLSALAVVYWQQAGQNAIARSAYTEAIVYLRRGLALIAMLPEAPERLQRELSLQMALGVALMSIKGYAAPEVEQAYVRARELCQQVDELPHLFTILRGLWIVNLVRGQLQTSAEVGGQLLQLAERSQDSHLALEAHRAAGKAFSFRAGWLMP